MVLTRCSWSGLKHRHIIADMNAINASANAIVNSNMMNAYLFVSAVTGWPSFITYMYPSPYSEDDTISYRCEVV